MAASKECLQMAISQRIALLLLQEPYVGAKAHVTCNRHVIQKPTSNRDKPVKSAVIVVDPTYLIIENPEHVSENIVGFIVKIGKFEVGIINVYLEKDGNIEEDTRKITRIVHDMATENVILTGDFNARSLWWGSRAEDKRGLLLSEMIAELDMNVLNQGSESTFYQYRGGKLYSSIVDVTCCTSAILHKMERWRVDPNFVTLSDHRAIQFQMKVKTDKQSVAVRNSTRLFNTAKANWSLFRNDLKEKLEKENVTENKIKTIDTPEELDDIVDSYVKQVKLACQKSIPTISKNVYKTCTPWWNTQLEAERCKDIRLRRRIKFANERRKPYVIQDFVEAKEKYINNIMTAITTSWKELCTKQEKETVWQSMYRIIKKCSASNQDKLLKSGDEILNANDSAMLLAKSFYPDDDKNIDTEEQTRIRDKADKITKELRKSTTISHRSFTEIEIEAVLDKMDPKKAPGEDGITSDICYQSYKTMPSTLMAIYNKSLEIGYFPKIWKNTIIK
ncbi:unnamed protein product [Parnassius mnemosyne]|uniref:Endonuclease/exonuclease/phosphatase domain-containing protein n=1 Tax=Parnassius mnemosyne TaxID=213953 RepID=A0AAV1LGV7_9NEOP